MYSSSWMSYLITLAVTHLTHQATSSETTPSQRYIVLDTTSDSPSWTAVLMAMEASSSPSNDFTLLGVLATDSPETETFNQLMESTGMSDCLNITISDEMELYPPDGYTLEDAPDTVKQLLAWVDAYPNQVTIYASSALTTVVYAAAIDPTFASKVAELVIVANLEEPSGAKADTHISFYNNSPFLKDQDAFLALLQIDGIPLIRIMGPLQPVLSGPEIAERVREAVQADESSSSPPEEEQEARRRKLASRPFAATYLAGHLARRLAGHQQAILLQEPGMAILVNPALISSEPDVEFSMESPDDDDSEQAMLMLRKISQEEVDPSERWAVIEQFDREKFWDLLVRIRSRDWNGFCKNAVEVGQADTQHDEL